MRLIWRYEYFILVSRALTDKKLRMKVRLLDDLCCSLFMLHLLIYIFLLFWSNDTKLFLLPHYLRAMVVGDMLRWLMGSLYVFSEKFEPFFSVAYSSDGF